MKNAVLIFALGALSSLSMAPYNFWPVIFLGLSVLYIKIKESASPKHAALLGFLFSFGYFTASLSWVGNALLVEDNPYWWAWPIAISGLPLILSLFTATTLYVHKIIEKKGNNTTTFLSFCTALFISEYARGNLFTGFPWNLYGYTWIETPLAQTASLSTIYLLTFMTIIWAVTPGFLITAKTKSKYAITAISIITIAICLLYGTNRIHNYQADMNDDVKITIIQPNIKQSEKWKREKIVDNFMSKINLSTPTENTKITAKEHYIIWPETAISQNLMDAPWFKDVISNTLKSYKIPTYLITGALRYDKEKNTYHNSIIIFDETAEIINTYNKSHLVPFGEYMPFENIIDIAPIVGFKGFQPGIKQPTINMPTGLKFKPYICYEIIFPDKKHTTNTNDMIINVTNDAWYGDSAGPYQHLVKTQFRAIESGMPTIRSANTGISAIINPIGQITNKIDLSDKGKIETTLPTKLENKKQSNHTDLAIILLFITVIVTIKLSKKLP